MLILFFRRMFGFGSSLRRVLARCFFRAVRIGFDLLAIVVLLVPFRRIFYIIVRGSFALIIFLLLRGSFLRRWFRFRIDFMFVLVGLLLLPIEHGIRCRWQWFVRRNRSSVST